MKKIMLALVLGCFWSSHVVIGQSSTLYDEAKIASIFVELPADSFQFLMANIVSERYMRARFVFDDGQTRDTVEDIGLRLRGNTSLGAHKKSFKISFNEFAEDREYQGVRKLNLRGQANDPTLVREKLYYEIWKNCGQPERRAAFVKLFVNGQYRGLYTNIEEIDKQWLKRAFDNKEGNLYKCLWPADLAWLGSGQQAYKAIMHGPGERAYRLVTNEDADDYSRFVALVQAINAPVNATYEANLRAILNVESVLKAYAIDISTGNWDDYFYLKNNYYLYDNPATGRFEWMAYDTDNCIGIDYLNRDWGKRDCLDWENHSEPRPLATKLLDVPELKAKFVFYLDSIARFVTCPDIIAPRIDQLHTLVSNDAIADPFRPLDNGYSVGDFHNNFSQPLPNKVPYGLKDFFQTRCSYTQDQIEDLISGNDEIGEAVAAGLRIFPNPVDEFLSGEMEVRLLSGQVSGAIFSATGQRLRTFQLDNSTGRFRIPVGDLPAGIWLLRLDDGRVSEARFFQKR